MIAIGKFRASINESCLILRKLEILVDVNNYPIYDSSFMGRVRPLSYFDQWKLCVREHYYDCLLSDHSFIQFNNDPYPSYSYYQFPLDALSFSEYADREFGKGWEYYAYEVREAYDQYLETQDRLRNVTPIRYDYDPTCYQSGRHPAAHVHIGLTNNIRIGADRQMAPLSFILFILRQCYPDHWDRFKELYKGKPIFKEVRDNIDKVPKKYWNPSDFHEVYLT